MGKRCSDCGGLGRRKATDYDHFHGLDLKCFSCRGTGWAPEPTPEQIEEAKKDRERRNKELSGLLTWALIGTVVAMWAGAIQASDSVRWGTTGFVTLVVIATWKEFLKVLIRLIILAILIGLFAYWKGYLVLNP